MPLDALRLVNKPDRLLIEKALVEVIDYWGTVLADPDVKLDRLRASIASDRIAARALLRRVQLADHTNKDDR